VCFSGVCAVVSCKAEGDNEADSEARKKLARHRGVTVRAGVGQSQRRATPGHGEGTSAAAGVDDVELHNYQPGEHAAQEVGRHCLCPNVTTSVTGWPKKSKPLTPNYH